jgi:hypothetical protein
VFVLHPENLPLLTDFIFKARSPVVSGLHLSGFEELHSLEVTTKSSKPLSMVVSKCKSLCNIAIKESLLRSFELSELPRLFRFDFRSCQLRTDATLNISGCPTLRKCDTCKVRVSLVGLEKIQLLEKAVRLQAADAQYFEFS